MSRLLVAIGALVLVGGFGPTPHSGAAAVAQEVEGDAGRMEEQEAKRFRAEMGLASDPATLRASYSDRTKYSSDEFGLPLTAAENAELLRRTGVQLAAGRAIEVASRHATYGGAYTDQLAGGVPVFTFTDEPAKYAAEIAQALPKGVVFRLERVERSFEAIRAVQARISERWSALEKEGIDVTSTGIRTDVNALDVGVTGLTPAIEERLQREFGPGLIIREESPAQADTCNSVHDCRPIKGGLEIRSQYNDRECTSGFIVKRVSTGSVYVLTAGHCIDVNGGYDKKWEHNVFGGTRNAFGWSRYETWVKGGSSLADVGLITISADEIPTRKNEIYVGGGVVETIVGFDYWPNQKVGDIALMSGQTGGDYAGTITRQMVENISDVPLVGSMRVTETMQVSFNPVGGDSGGPVFYRHPDGGGKRIALGTHIHSDDGSSSETGDGWYSPYDRGDADMIRVHGVSWDYSLCVTASC